MHRMDAIYACMLCIVHTTYTCPTSAAVLFSSACTSDFSLWQEYFIVLLLKEQEHHAYRERKAGSATSTPDLRTHRRTRIFDVRYMPAAFCLLLLSLREKVTSLNPSTARKGCGSRKIGSFLLIDWDLLKIKSENTRWQSFHYDRRVRETTGIHGPRSKLRSMNVIKRLQSSTSLQPHSWSLVWPLSE